MTMIKQASHAIEHMTAKERRIQRAKYARRNKMHHIDKLLNELEMLNLAAWLTQRSIYDRPKDQRKGVWIDEAFFLSEVPGEQGHAQFLANKIVALGGEPTTVPRPVPEAREATGPPAETPDGGPPDGGATATLPMPAHNTPAGGTGGLY